MQLVCTRKDVMAIPECYSRIRKMNFRPQVQSVVRFFADLVPLTLAGALILVVSATAFVLYGVKRLDLVVLAASLFIIAIVFLVGLLVSSVAIWLRFTWPKRLCYISFDQPCFIPAPTGFDPELPSWLPLVEIDWRWIEPSGITVDPRSFETGHGEFVVGKRRGRAEFVVRKVTIRDIFGLTSIRLSFTSQATVRVTPAFAELANLDLFQSLASGDERSDPRGSKEGDRVDMRRYAQGDPVRLILWKVYARTRKLLVRIPERAMAMNPRTCAFFVAGPGDEGSAALARVVIEQGLLGESWRFGADGAKEAAYTVDHAIDALVESGSFLGNTPSRLGDFLKEAETSGFAICLVFVPPRPGKWSDRIVMMVSRSRLKIHVFTATEIADSDRRAHSWLQKLIFQPPRIDAVTRTDVRALAHKFQGVPVTVVERSTGRLLGDPRHWPEPQR